MIALTRNGPQPEPRSVGVQACVAGLTEAGPQLQPVNAADRARDASVEAPLDRGQKSALVLLAKQAWERLRLVDEEIESLDTWRRRQAVEACGCRISEAQVKHFSALKRHFLNLAGDAGRAFRAAMREGTEAERIAMTTLERECDARGLRMDYPAQIARKQFKRGLQDCTAKQLWCLVFTIRNRRKPAGPASRCGPASVRPATDSADPF